MFEIAIDKPKFGVDLYLNTFLFICQFIGKPKHILVVFIGVF